MARRSIEVPGLRHGAPIQLEIMAVLGQG